MDTYGLPVGLVASVPVACEIAIHCFIYVYIGAYVYGLVACGSVACGQFAWNPIDSYGMLEESRSILQNL